MWRKEWDYEQVKNIGSLTEASGTCAVRWVAAASCLEVGGAAVAAIQSGAALTIADTNANNVFGISEDRAQLSGKCTKNQLVTTVARGL